MQRVVLGSEEDVLMRSRVKQPSWLSKVCCVHSFVLFCFFFLFVSLALVSPLRESWKRGDRRNYRLIIWPHKVLRAAEDVLKKCGIRSVSSTRLDGGADGRVKNKVLRSVEVAEKEVAAGRFSWFPFEMSKLKLTRQSVEGKMKGTETNGLESQKHEDGERSLGVSSSRKEEMLGRAGSG